MTKIEWLKRTFIIDGKDTIDEWDRVGSEVPIFKCCVTFGKEVRIGAKTGRAELKSVIEIPGANIIEAAENLAASVEAEAQKLEKEIDRQIFEAKMNAPHPPIPRVPIIQ